MCFILDTSRVQKKETLNLILNYAYSNSTERLSFDEILDKEKDFGVGIQKHKSLMSKSH